MLGIVCGMAAERHALGRWTRDERVRVGISGARPDQAEREAHRLVESGCRVLLSWGVAGGLDPALRPGDLTIPALVVDEAAGRWPLLQALAGSVPVRHRPDAPLLGVDRMLLTPTEKAARFTRTGALAADMETHRVARIAAEAGLPALAVRAVGDPAGATLPELALRALGPRGRPRIGAVMAGLVRRPADLLPLLGVRGDTRVALFALSQVADSILEALIEAIADRR